MLVKPTWEISKFKSLTWSRQVRDLHEILKWNARIFTINGSKLKTPIFLTVFSYCSKSNYLCHYQWVSKATHCIIRFSKKKKEKKKDATQYMQYKLDGSNERILSSLVIIYTIPLLRLIQEHQKISLYLHTVQASKTF